MLILLSGGIDSTACVTFYKDLGRSSCGLFIDYGQPALKQEAESAKTIANYYSIPLLSSMWIGNRIKSSGYICGRNSFLITAALMECPESVSVIAIGIHSGTNYSDCSPQFLNKMQEVLDLYTLGKLHLSAPFLEFSKSEIYSYCMHKKIPVNLTYSCEWGGPMPCGECLSCKDREILNAGL